ncbi:hypothetical protein PVK06_016981 [Gossypium arboreum]|uniref:Uncharacterized protein n=1 Tax=Gossypium arboreum TaxID=29729 RepID=A0ABR0Q2A2_GOSAR|nr:hypothetical protein PVK06_016981 [Gossypium arboreum]
MEDFNTIWSEDKKKGEAIRSSFKCALYWISDKNHSSLKDFEEKIGEDYPIDDKDKSKYVFNLIGDEQTNQKTNVVYQVQLGRHLVLGIEADDS